MKDTLKIIPPQGFKLGNYNEQTGEIEILKEEKEKYPMWFEEIRLNEGFYITCPLVSSMSIANAFTALMKLVELRDAWNNIDGFVVDWGDIYRTSGQDKYCIYTHHGLLCCNTSIPYPKEWKSCILSFGSASTAILFNRTFLTLIEEAKELL